MKASLVDELKVVNAEIDEQTKLLQESLNKKKSCHEPEA